MLQSRAEYDERHKAGLRRQRARWAGRASGRARRRLAKGRRVPHARDRGQALALAYPVRQVSRARFGELYAAACRDVWHVNVHQGGEDTAYLEYRLELRAYRAQGQDYQTTNGQRARALELAGRARCPRTVRRTRQRLADMGLCAYHHVKRQRARPGFKDTIRVRVLFPARRPGNFMSPRPTGSPSRDSVPTAGACRNGLKSSSEPPDGGEIEEAASPPGTEEGARAQHRQSGPPPLPDLDDWGQSVLAGWGYAAAGGDG